MAYELTGKIKLIMEEQSFSSGFSKREFVVTSEEDKFPQDIKFECLKDKASLLSELEVGQRVKVHFDISGREWQGKYFVNLTAWRIDPLGASNGPVEEEGPLPPDDFDESGPF